MATYTVIGFQKEGFDPFSTTVSAPSPEKAAQKAISDMFIKIAGRPAPQTHALAQLESETGLFINGIVEGEHENINEDLDHHAEWS